MRNLRFAAIVLALAVGLASCTSGPGASPTVGPTGTTGAATTPGSKGTGGGAGASPGPRPSVSTPPTAASFVLTEGKQHLACGITMTVTFVPPSATGGRQDQAFLVAGSTASPDQPQPGTVAPANPGATATVLGRRFRVLAVDPVHATVTLEALC